MKKQTKKTTPPSMEDVLEEIVGEIRDEFDGDEVADIRTTGKNEYMINGRVLLVELEERFGLSFNESEDIDTIAGWIHQKKFDEVQEGDKLELGEYLLVVKEMDNHKINQILFKKLEHIKK